MSANHQLKDLSPTPLDIVTGLEAIRRKHHSVEQILAVLRQAEAGVSVRELIRRVNITEQTFYRWKKAYGSLGASHIERLKELQKENARLRKLLASIGVHKEQNLELLKKKCS